MTISLISSLISSIKITRNSLKNLSTTSRAASIFVVSKVGEYVDNCFLRCNAARGICFYFSECTGNQTLKSNSMTLSPCDEIGDQGTFFLEDGDYPVFMSDNNISHGQHRDKWGLGYDPNTCGTVFMFNNVAFAVCNEFLDFDTQIVDFAYNNVVKNRERSESILFFDYSKANVTVRECCIVENIFTHFTNMEMRVGENRFYGNEFAYPWSYPSEVGERPKTNLVKMGYDWECVTNPNGVHRTLEFSRKWFIQGGIPFLRLIERH